jgi:hypothetical protein
LKREKERKEENFSLKQNILSEQNKGRKERARDRAILFCAHHRSISNSTRALAKRFSSNECDIRQEKSAFDRTRCISNPEIGSIRGKNDDTRANANFHISALLRKNVPKPRERVPLVL